MIFEEKKITLKDGRIAVLKTPSISDAEKMLSYIKKACGETDFLARYPEEWESVSAESEAEWIKGNRESEGTLMITAYVDGEVVGNCQISRYGNMKTSHRATIAIGILKEYWNMGIGSAMFREMIAAARKNPDISIVELDFVEGNTRAQALYEKFGFKIVGERPNAFKLKDGRLLSEYFMQLQIR